MVKSEVKPFYLFRKEDASGVSGTGVVALGAQLPSGRCVLEFQSVNSSLIIFNNMHSLETVHGHEGKTQIIMGHPPLDKTKKRKRREEEEPGVGP